VTRDGALAPRRGAAAPRSQLIDQCDLPRRHTQELLRGLRPTAVGTLESFHHSLRLHLEAHSSVPAVRKWAGMRRPGNSAFNSSARVLGNGTDKGSNVPVQVSHLQGIVAIAAHGENSLALTKDGTVWSWGDNSAGQLGNGTTDDGAEPVQVKNLTGVTSIAAGSLSSFARTKDGTVWVWGDSSRGRLANGVGRDSNVPVRLSSLIRR